MDRSSAFVRAYKLAGTKTKNIISSLEDFLEAYYRPPLLLTQIVGHNLVLPIGPSKSGQMRLVLIMIYLQLTLPSQMGRRELQSNRLKWLLPTQMALLVASKLSAII